MMDKELKRKWIEALRSGKYQQGRQYLRCGNKFCCLGVLCDIVKPDSWIPSTSHDEPVYKFVSGEVKNSLLLPWEIEKMLGDWHRETTMAVDTLMAMNDTRMNSFDEIADWIEENL